MADPRIEQLAVAAKAARSRSGLSQRQAGEKLGWTDTKILNIEKGRIRKVPPRSELEALDSLYGTNGQLVRIAGYTEIDPDIRAVLRQVVEKHVEALLEDVSRLYGRS